MPKKMFDAEYWRDRAEEVRVYAADTKDPAAKRTLLGVARVYDELAEDAERMRKAHLAEACHIAGAVDLIKRSNS